MSEQELKILKEQIKKELMEEMKKPRNESVWKKAKREYEDEFKKFNYIDHWECLNCDNKLITRDKEIIAEYPIQNAIGTLLRITYKAENVNKVSAEYEDVKDFIEKILDVLKEKAKV